VVGEGMGCRWDWWELAEGRVKGVRVMGGHWRRWDVAEGDESLLAMRNRRDIAEGG
jgi:hypothetical protein